VPDLSIKPISPLGFHEAQTDEIGNVHIAEVISCSLASIAQRVGQEKAFLSSAKKALKVALPNPGMSISKNELTVFWTAQEQWFVEAPLETHEDIAAVLKKDFKQTASVTEQTGGWCRFDVKGIDCVSMLERLCAVDVAELKIDQATRSVIEHIGIFIICREEKTWFSIYAPASFAGSLHHALTTAAKSIA